MLLICNIFRQTNIVVFPQKCNYHPTKFMFVMDNCHNDWTNVHMHTKEGGIFMEILVQPIAPFHTYYYVLTISSKC